MLWEIKRFMEAAKKRAIFPNLYSFCPAGINDYIKEVSSMLPTREEAHRLLEEAELHNPGPWGDHSRVAARCAEKIAVCCTELDSEKAYILGLLHDIGRRFGVRHLGHVYDGYHYMRRLGYDEAARICLTHSFVEKDLQVYVGKHDISQSEEKELSATLYALEYDEYDRLIQLCDSLAGAEGVMDMEARMLDVKKRYGFYPQSKWDATLRLRTYFEERMGRNLYDVVGKPGDTSGGL